MSMIKTFLKEMEQEATTTRKMLERIPDDKFGWQPHPKSMTIKQLATHIAELPGWVNMTLDIDGLDFQQHPYKQEDINNTKDLLAYFETTLNNATDRLKQADDTELNGRWVLRSGDTVLRDAAKDEFIRSTINQIIHHRAQMGVNLRLLDIAIPGSYGPSADEQMM